MGALLYDLRVIRAVALKDMRTALTERVFTALGVILPVNFLLLFLLFVLTGGQAPTAVVMEDQGPYAQQFLNAMRSARSFTITETSAENAQHLMSQGQIVAIVTVPASFDSAMQQRSPIALPVVVNNLNVDFTNDIRRAVPLAITSFYAQVFPDQVVVHASEVDVHAQDTGYIEYLSVSIFVISLLVGGLVQAGTNAAREYEDGTIKELLLAPASRWAIEVGKLSGAAALNVLSAGVVLAVVVLVLGVGPVHWGEVAGDTALVMLTFLSLGLLIGTLVKRRTAVVPLSIGLGLPVFFISGAFGPVQWSTPVVAVVSRLQPVYYAIAVFQHAFHDFDTTPSSLTANLVVLGVSAVVSLLLSATILRRSGVAH